MTWVATAVVGGAVIGGLASKSASKSQSKAAGKAADASLQATRETIDENARQYDLSRSDQAPFMEAGANAIGAQEEMLFGAKDNPYGKFTGSQPGDQQGAGQAGAQGGWDEQAYLQNNPDVAAAVADGQFATGAAHYEMYGKHEKNRNTGQWTPAEAYDPEANPEMEAYIAEFVDPAMADQFRQLPPDEMQKYLDAGGDTSPTPNENLPSNEHLGSEVPGRDYAEFMGPDARTDPGAIDNVDPVWLPGGAYKPQLGGPAQLPDVFGGYNAPDVMQNPNISTDVGVDAPEFTTADTSMEAFQNSPLYQSMLFQMEQGQRAQDAQMSGAGITQSGRYDKALSRFQAGTAGQSYGQFSDQALREARQRNIDEEAEYRAAMGISQEGYGREMDSYAIGHQLYGDERQRQQDIYGAGQDRYAAQLGQAQYGYETDQERIQRNYANERLMKQDITDRQMNMYGMQVDQHGRAVSERDKGFARSGQLYAEQYAAEEARRARDIEEFGLDRQEFFDNYGLREGERTTGFNMLAGLSGTGQVAASDLGRQGAYMANANGNARGQGSANYGTALLAAAQADASGTVGMANAFTGGLDSWMQWQANKRPTPTRTGTFNPNAMGGGLSGGLLD